eukprot:NODE_416_length_9017_cov_0.133326.p2 type:complete len:492 gc:universal NODE_416_length_9017_cov_0.133326:6623-8098(+)
MMLTFTCLFSMALQSTGQENPILAAARAYASKDQHDEFELARIKVILVKHRESAIAYLRDPEHFIPKNTVKAEVPQWIGDDYEEKVKTAEFLVAKVNESPNYIHSKYDKNALSLRAFILYISCDASPSNGHNKLHLCSKAVEAYTDSEFKLNTRDWVFLLSYNPIDPDSTELIATINNDINRNEDNILTILTDPVIRDRDIDLLSINLEWLYGVGLSSVFNNLFEIVRKANDYEESRTLFFKFVEEFFPQCPSKFDLTPREKRIDDICVDLAAEVRSAKLAKMFLDNDKLRSWHTVAKMFEYDQQSRQAKSIEFYETIWPYFHLTVDVDVGGYINQYFNLKKNYFVKVREYIGGATSIKNVPSFRAYALYGLCEQQLQVFDYGSLNRHDVCSDSLSYLKNNPILFEDWIYLLLSVRISPKDTELIMLIKASISREAIERIGSVLGDLKSVATAESHYNSIKYNTIENNLHLVTSTRETQLIMKEVKKANIL